MPQYNETYLPTLIHEFNHSFINCLLDNDTRAANREALEKPGKLLLESSLWAMNKQAYGNWQTIINESLVKAAVICYMLDKKYDQKDIRSALTEQIQRNFRWMPELVHLFRKYQDNRSQYPTLEAFYPQVIQFFDEYTQNQEDEINSVVNL